MFKKTLILLLLLMLTLTSCSKAENDLDVPFLNWQNATNGIYIYKNNGDFDFYGGFKKNNKNKKSSIKFLEENFGITNQIDTVTVINTLKTGYINEAFKNEYEYYSNNLDIDTKTNTLIDKKTFVLETYEKKGENALLGFDLGRASMIVSYSYLADYISLNQAIQYSYDISTIIQDNFTSWSDYTDSYLKGVYYLVETEKDLKLYEEYVKAETDLLISVDTPFLIDFNLDLNSAKSDF